ncbi:MAG: RNA polymerase sigma factor [Pirellulales bacterium]
MALNQAQFQRMVTEHGPALYRTAYRFVGDVQEAEDLVQETYRSAWKSRHRFETGRGARAWLIAILRRRTIDRWRRRPQPKVIGNGELPDVSVPPDDFLADEYSDEMQRALSKLSHDLRETLLLVVVGELTHQETANLLEVPLGTILSRVSRARQQLRKTLLAAVSE